MEFLTGNILSLQMFYFCYLYSYYSFYQHIKVIKLSFYLVRRITIISWHGFGISCLVMWSKFIFCCLLFVVDRYEDDPIIGHRLYREIRKVEVRKAKVKGSQCIPSVSEQWETVATNLDEFLDVSVSEKISALVLMTYYVFSIINTRWFIYLEAAKLSMFFGKQLLQFLDQIERRSPNQQLLNHSAFLYSICNL